MITLMYDVIIIGSGASGLFLAANLPGMKVLVLEKNERPGKKILLTGGGMCNLTNCDDIPTFLSHFKDKRQSNFLKPALMNFSTEQARRWFEAHGLALLVRDDGKVFPESLHAQSVIDTLLSQARDSGVVFLYSQKVTSLAEDSGCFSVSTDKETYHAVAVVLATGGMSYPTTGSTGDGYVLAKGLGHSLVPPTPALVGVSVQDYPFAGLAGNSIRQSLVDFTHKDEPKRYLKAKGDLLFTHDGLSGPVVLNNARYIKKGDVLSVSLVSTENKETARQEILSLFQDSPKKRAYTLIKGLGLFSNLAERILAGQAISKEETCANLSKEQRKNLVSALLDYHFVVSEKKSFSSAMVTAGGLFLDQFDRKTLESRLVPGFFATGEVLDVDGDTGGYNLQSAFSTAMLVARALLSKRA